MEADALGQLQDAVVASSSLAPWDSISTPVVPPVHSPALEVDSRRFHSLEPPQLGPTLPSSSIYLVSFFHLLEIFLPPPTSNLKPQESCPQAARALLPFFAFVTPTLVIFLFYITTQYSHSFCSVTYNLNPHDAHPPPHGLACPWSP